MDETQTITMKRQNRVLEILAAAVLALVIGVIFWSGQRYPSLLKKLHAGSTLRVGGPISFDAILPVSQRMPTAERVGRTAVNWIWTNRFGMYFALPFGAAMMTVLAQTGRTKRFSHGAANVICGAVAGMPLGVCSNCATPIGQGLLIAGASSRLTVATMISSPSFNPVVVAMTFVLFPWRLAIMRVIVPLLILLALPLLVREREPGLQVITMSETPKPVGERLKKTAQLFLHNLVRLTLLTLPWMILAAIAGAFAVEVIPAYGTHFPVSVPGIFLVAALGTLLPVPMAFDVSLAWVLYQAGVPGCYVVALLCTLGIVSLYSLTALGQQLGSITSLKLAGATTLAGTAAGLIVLWFPAA